MQCFTMLRSFEQINSLLKPVPKVQAIFINRYHLTNFIEENELLVVFTAENKIFVYKEKDLPEKLQSLYSNNLYERAIALAMSYQYDTAKIAEIYQQYFRYLK